MAAPTSPSLGPERGFRGLEPPRDLWASWGAFGLGLAVLAGVVLAHAL